MRQLQRFIALGTAVVFLYSTVASPLGEANFWAERRQAAKRMKQNDGGNNSSPLLLLKEINSWPNSSLLKTST